jgi:hypothetical protein
MPKTKPRVCRDAKSARQLVARLRRRIGDHLPNTIPTKSIGLSRTTFKVGILANTGKGRCERTS